MTNLHLPEDSKNSFNSYKIKYIDIDTFAIQKRQTWKSQGERNDLSKY